MGKREIERQFRIDYLRKEISASWLAGETIDLKRFEALNCYNLGISRRIFREYLDIALILINGEIKADQIIYKNGKQQYLNA